MNDNDIDRLKKLAEVYLPDERQHYFSTTLEREHERLSEIQLNTTTPRTALQLFETAKNLSLYSWFVYRFHQVAELTAFSALEVALKEKYENETLGEQSEKKQPKLTLYFLMQHAKDNEWIKNEGFPSLYSRAWSLAEDKKNSKHAQLHDFDKEPEMICEAPSKQEVDEALKELDLVSAVAENTNKIRNDLAHGSNILHSNSLSTLVLVAEVINQLYE
ncbi:hypothetical protein [Brumicola nitratireducens]|nr:hypothetical protein [Glaciecola nitratireducens]